MKRRDGWDASKAEGGAWSAESRSDGERWQPIKDAAQEAGRRARRIWRSRDERD